MRHTVKTRVLTSALVALTIALEHGAAQTRTPFAVIVNGYLDRFAAYHPSIAAGNGLHGHDGELEDFRPLRSRPS